MGCTPSSHSTPSSPLYPPVPIILTNNNHEETTDALITSPARKKPPTLPSASTVRPRLGSVLEATATDEEASKISIPNLSVMDMSLKRPLTQEERHFNINYDDDVCLLTPTHGVTHGVTIGIDTTTTEIEKIIEDLKDGELFEDPDFRAGTSALFYSKKTTEQNYEWKRPFEMSPDPSLYVDGTSRRDVIQGILGDCWLLSTCAAIAKREDLIHRVLNPDQPLKGPGYKGYIKVNLWQYGRWETVIIDDKLPIIDGKYVYARCFDVNEFWVAMIEKAFAKLHGSYEAIEGGMPIEAMVDLTGGLAERYELGDPALHQKLYKYLRKSFAAQAFIACSRKGDWRMSYIADQNGLIQGHAYSITGLFRIPPHSKEQEEFNVKASGDCRTHLLRVRNPWGDKNEWKGDWCDVDEKWKLVPEFARKSMGQNRLIDGEFWMEFFKDFCQEFDSVSICTLGPDFNQDGVVDTAKSVKVIFGEWSADDPGFSAGGCRNDFQMFAKNPQYLLRIPQVVEEEKSQVIITLTQRHKRSLSNKKVRLLQIGFSIYRLPHHGDYSPKRLKEDYFSSNYDIGTSGPYINCREIFGRFELNFGDYVVIPATFQSGAAGQFMIRVYNGANCQECDIFELKEH